MLPLITATAVHTHTPLLFPSDPRTSDVKKRGNQALPNSSLSFLCSLHPSLLKFFTVCTVTWKCKGTDCILPGFSKLASVQVLTKRMQEKENVLSHRCPLHDPLVSLYSAGRGRNWKSSEMDQKFSSFFSPPASSLSRHISQFCT